MSPILVRPVREQFEHDRIIRVLQAKYKRKYEVAINPGAEQAASVMVGELAMYPDLVLFSPERARKIQGTVEVETTESINTLEAQAEWGPFSRLRAAFFLYVPASTIDTVRRLCTEHGIAPTEIWTYHAAMDQVRFTMVYRSPEAPKIGDVRSGPVARVAEPGRAPEAPAGEQRSTSDRSLRPVGARPASAGQTAGPNGKGAEARAKAVKARPQKKAAPIRRAKSVKKPGSAKKLPRAAAARPRKAAKTARKSATKRSATPKR